MEGFYNIEDIFKGYSIVIRTPVPILGIKYCLNNREYSFKYITRINITSKEGSQLNVVEYLTGNIPRENINKMLEDKLPIYIALESANNKKRVVNINGREKTIEVVNNFEKYYNNLPNSEVMFSQMPTDIKLKDIKEHFYEK